MSKRPRRMVVWLVVAPIMILLLALGGANWKKFHLVYAKHLIGSTDRQKQYRGVDMVVRTHLGEGMPLEEVRRLLAPAGVTERGTKLIGKKTIFYEVTVGKSPREKVCLLIFDASDGLIYVELWKLGTRKGTIIIPTGP